MGFAEHAHNGDCSQRGVLEFLTGSVSRLAPLCAFTGHAHNGGCSPHGVRGFLTGSVSRLAPLCALVHVCALMSSRGEKNGFLSVGMRSDGWKESFRLQ